MPYSFLGSVHYSEPPIHHPIRTYKTNKCSPAWKILSFFLNNSTFHCCIQCISQPIFPSGQITTVVLDYFWLGIMNFQAMRFFPFSSVLQLSVLRPPAHLNPNNVRIINYAHNNGTLTYLYTLQCHMCFSNWTKTKLDNLMDKVTEKKDTNCVDKHMSCGRDAGKLYQLQTQHAKAKLHLLHVAESYSKQCKLAAGKSEPCGVKI